MADDSFMYRNIQIVEEGTTKDIIDLIEESTTLVIGFIIAIVINWKLALVVGSFLPLTLATIFIAQKVILYDVNTGICSILS